MRTLRKEAARGRIEGISDCFTYSYAARKVFEWCGAAGIRRTLGQVDPGIGEWKIIRQLRDLHPEWNESQTDMPPEAYWNDWHRELELADSIIVNSEWSMKAPGANLADPAKLKVIPLAFEEDLMAAMRTHHSNLRVLFLGQVCLRKGIPELVECARMMVGERAQFDIVGQHGRLPIGIPANMRFHGKVGRPDAGWWYRNSDVFVLPTHSDGFALTQLEAMSHGLPVVTTDRCGRLADDGKNGFVIRPSDPAALADSLRVLIGSPDLRQSMGEQARRTASRFTIHDSRLITSHSDFWIPKGVNLVAETWISN